MYKRQLTRLVNDLLDLSRIQHAEFRLNMERVNLCDIISEVRRSAQNMAKEKELTVTTEMDTGLYFMQGDYLRLRQLLMIAMSNAIKFSPRGGQIEMCLFENIPVSYTHLDVYKRQTHSCIQCAPQRLPTVQGAG